MDKRYIISLQGRDFVTYEGLLEEAHHQGLASIRTQLVQIPSEANGNTAICTAEVTLNARSGPKVFTGIGDASPRNVNRNIALHLIRMSETRAKARALRDAINVGITAYEELEEAELGREVGDLAGTPEVTLSTRPATKAELDGVRASQAQIDKATSEMRRAGFTTEAGRAYLLKKFGKSSRFELSHREIEAFLAYLKKLPTTEAASSTA